MNDNSKFEIPFTVDAGLIDRLGRELVGRAETALSELIKNAYDADANKVELNFINSSDLGGSLTISDDGDGMTFEELTKGFMTISSPDKIHNPITKTLGRKKAGRKGIGRFATQRLGHSLTIITQTEASDHSLKLQIDWDRYQIDTELSSIKNPVVRIPKEGTKGTTVVIENLRDYWSLKSIERVYRYVSELLQPNYLSDRSSALKLATRNDDSFSVCFYKTDNDVKSLVASPQKMLFDKALATIEGYVDENGDGFYGVKSQSLGIDDYGVSVEASARLFKYEHVRNIHFKAYYFIYNRSEYYSGISKLELKNIQSLSNEYSGIRLYRNGFRVLPYGEQSDDWLGLDIRYAGESSEGPRTNIPFANRNLFGFVEVVDPQGHLFEETASREGLIENEALYELKDFTFKALTASRLRIAERIKIKREELSITPEPLQAPFVNPQDKFQELQNYISATQNNANAFAALEYIQQQIENLLEEMGMLRVLAGLGLTIAEFTHEIIQFTPSINGYLFALRKLQKAPEGIELIEKLNRSFKHFTSYTSYFNATVSQNVSRELKPILLIDVVNNFIDIINQDAEKQNILIKSEYFGLDLYTVPMHPSEWGSILFNLYTNSKKAIRRAESEGRINIIGGRDGDIIYLEFLDNGDGIAENIQDRIFNAFFTTSTPAGFDATKEDKLTGTGLGLKIVKDIIQSYGGKIFLTRPEKGYVTNFRIELPQATKQQLKEYGY